MILTNGSTHWLDLDHPKQLLMFSWQHVLICGSAGLMFTLANSIAVSMYTIGFAESLLDMFQVHWGPLDKYCKVR
jgi:hypothetical protein